MATPSSTTRICLYCGEFVDLQKDAYVVVVIEPLCGHGPEAIMEGLTGTAVLHEGCRFRIRQRMWV